MRFMMIYKPADRASAESGVPPTQEEMAKMGKLIEVMAKAGVLPATDGLKPSSKGVRVRLSGSKLTVTDGPVEWARRFLELAGDGESEIRGRRRPRGDSSCRPTP